MTISATSKPNDTSFSEEDREFIWKNTSIQKIAQTIAGRYSLELAFDGKDAEIVKREQKATDSSFLDASMQRLWSDSESVLKEAVDL